IADPGRRLLDLLEWMAAQPFDLLVAGDQPLLPAVESVVVDAHRRWSAAHGATDWSEPKAYHWLHYEDPDPVSRLADGVRRLPPDLSVSTTTGRPSASACRIAACTRGSASCLRDMTGPSWWSSGRSRCGSDGGR